jgi:hypothetical protein
MTAGWSKLNSFYKALFLFLGLESDWHHYRTGPTTIF